MRTSINEPLIQEDSTCDESKLQWGEISSGSPKDDQSEDLELRARLNYTKTWKTWCCQCLLISFIIFSIFAIVTCFCCFFLLP